MRRWLLVLLFVSPILVLPVAMLAGRVWVPPEALSKLLLGSRLAAADEALHAVIWQVRLPRILLALLVGAALSVSGAALQQLCRNPLVSPHIMGVSAGACFGAALSVILWGGGYGTLQIFALVFGCMAVAITYSLSRLRGGSSTVSLVLAGIIVSACFAALLFMAYLLADPDKVAQVVYWSMGSLHAASWSDVVKCLPGIAVGTTVLYAFRWRLGVLSLGEEAKSLGVAYEWERFILLASTTLVTAFAVSVAGTVAWVGLVVPHLVRLMLGADTRALIPASVTFGGAFVLAADTLARTIYTYDLPVGILTTLIGAPFFLYLLRRSRAAWA